MVRKVLALLVAVLMLFCHVPLTTAAKAVPVLTIQTVSAQAGRSIDVAVQMTNNPGLLGAILTFTFPSELTLMKVSVGEALEGLEVSYPPTQTSPYTLFCDGVNTPSTADGILLLLTFFVAEDAAASFLEISASYLAGDVVDGRLNEVPLAMQSGGVTVIAPPAISLGDADGNGRINNRDLGLLQRHLNGWDVAIDVIACDMDGNGKVTNRDLGLLQKQINSGETPTPTTPTLTVESRTACPGEMVPVSVRITHNPGLLGAILSYDYDPALTLCEAQAGAVLDALEVAFSPYSAPFTMFCDGLDRVAAADGVVATLYFQIPEDAAVGQTFSVSASHLEGDVVDGSLADVTPAMVSGVITVI